MAVTTKKGPPPAETPMPSARPVGESVQGEVVSLSDPTGAAAQLPAIPASPPFFYAVHPDAWSVRFDEDGAPVLLPSLQKVKAQAGVNGCDVKNGQVSWRPAASRVAESGWTVIPHSAGPGGRSYMRAIECRGGMAHVSMFDRVYAGSDTVDCDRRALGAWIDGLVKAGTIPGPSQMALRRERDAAARRQLDAAGKANHSPTAADQAKTLAKVVAYLSERITAARGRAVSLGDDAPSLDETA